jgi:alanyl-tRNA synthetase
VRVSATTVNSLLDSRAVARFAYERDAYLTELDTDVLEVGDDGGRPYAVTADTVFYPEGGGQPADRGTMAGADVTGVVRVAGVVRHHLAEPIGRGPVHQRIDWSRRFDHMQQHTAQHLLTALALVRFGWPTTAFHLGPRLSDVELDGPALSRDDLDRLEDAVNHEVRAARAVTVRYAEASRMGDLGVRSRILPQDFASNELRLVEIEGIDLNTCGGTHVCSTAEIGAVALLGAEPMRGGTRVFFVAGDRVRQRLVEHELRNARLRSILDSADDDLPGVVELRISKEKQLARDRRRLTEELAEEVAGALAAEPDLVVARHWDEHDMGFLQKLGRRLVETAPTKVVLLTSGVGREGLFVIAAGSDAAIDVAVVGPDVAAVMDGRGGGAAGLFQGRAARPAAWREAAALLRARVQG